MTLRALATLVSASLCLSQVIWHVQANAPRDWQEHALAVARRMTFNDSGPEQLGARRLPALSMSAEMPMNARQAAVTYVLRMLGLPRMRTTPVELRP